MKDTAYRYMDWPRMEDFLYGEEQNPRSLLAPRAVKEGILYQCFIPGAEKVSLLDKASGKKHAMFEEDENGWFALVLKQKQPVKHSFIADGKEYGDPYAYERFFTRDLVKRLASGTEVEAYRYLGAHLKKLDGEDGIAFAVWAPNASRVSVVGDFNNWDGRAHQMNLIPECGIYELFIPGLSEGCTYKYELRLPDGLVYMRPDPYSQLQKKGEISVSVAADSRYAWNDASWKTEQGKIKDRTALPMAIYECPVEEAARIRGFERNEAFRKLAEVLPAELEEKGYTHVEFTPVAEYANEESGGYHTTSYFAVSNRFGTPDEFRALIDAMHGHGIGVILDWNASQFSQDTDYLSFFDGTALYEHLDPRLGTHPQWGTKLFNYGRAEVRGFLISNAYYWLKEFHLDGLRLPGCDVVLRQDFGRENSFVPNMMGGGENLDGIAFLKELALMKKRFFPAAMLMMEQGIFWPDVTSAPEDGGLGFDFEWNLHFTTDLLRYMSLDDEGRKNENTLLLNGMLGNYFHNAVISLSRGVGLFDRNVLLETVNGRYDEKEALLRAAYVYLFTHPGKKLLTEGEDNGTPFFKDLLTLYNEDAALFEEDYLEEGFEWIRCFDEEKALIAFSRESAEEKDYLLCVFNFSDENLPRLGIGVPYAGRYKEILNTDKTSYGGCGTVNPRAKATKEEECDERANTLYIRLAARSAAVFRFQG